MAPVGQFEPGKSTTSRGHPSLGVLEELVSWEDRGRDTSICAGSQRAQWDPHAATSAGEEKKVTMPIPRPWLPGNATNGHAILEGEEPTIYMTKLAGEKHTLVAR